MLHTHKYNWYCLSTVRRSHDSQMAPLECSYLSRNAQLSITGQVPQPVKHFALKRKSKSAALRAELLQKCKRKS